MGGPRFSVTGPRSKGPFLWGPWHLSGVGPTGMEFVLRARVLLSPPHQLPRDPVQGQVLFYGDACLPPTPAYGIGAARGVRDRGPS